MYYIASKITSITNNVKPGDYVIYGGIDNIKSCYNNLQKAIESMRIAFSENGDKFRIFKLVEVDINLEIKEKLI